VGVLGAVSATAGNTAAFAAENVKRLLAWSSIAHAGYMLCAISLRFNLGAAQTDAAGRNGPARVLLFYLAVYLFMNLGAFTVVGLVGRASGREDLHAFRGLAKRNPVLAHSMFACLVSLIGLPPFAGFVAKLNVLFVLMSNGGWWWWLVGVIAVNSVVSAFYYFRIVRAMYLEPADEPGFVAHPAGVAVAATCGIALLLMLVLASPANNLARRYARLQGVTGTTRPGGPDPASASARSP
jgi:NADH-quinone oxidoreductase subunit N